MRSSVKEPDFSYLELIADSDSMDNKTQSTGDHPNDVSIRKT
jgi:hypothetical protein